nr:TetR/AcrR family transcriptional regulator [Sphingomonas xinjiangensis]
MISNHRGTRGGPTPERQAALDSAILEFGKRSFSEKGVGRTSMEEVSTQLGVSKHTVYRRHPSKLALLKAVLLKDVDDSHETSLKNEITESPEGARRLLLGYVHGEIRRLSSNLYKRVEVEAVGVEEVKNLLICCAARAEDFVRKPLENGYLVRAGDPFYPKHLSEVAVDMLQGLVRRAMLGRLSGPDIEAAFEVRWQVLSALTEKTFSSGQRPLPAPFPSESEECSGAV